MKLIPASSAESTMRAATSSVVRSPNIIVPRQSVDTLSPLEPSLLYSIPRPFDHVRRDFMIHVIAIITAKPGQRESIMASARANLTAVRAEDGCIEYGFATDAEGIGSFQTKFSPDTFVFIEKWR